MTSNKLHSPPSLLMSKTAECCPPQSLSDKLVFKMADGLQAFWGKHTVTIGCLSVAAIQGLVAFFLGHVLGRKLPSVEKWIIVWLLYDALVHFTLV